MAANSWLQNDNGDGTQQLPGWLQAIIKGGAAGGTATQGGANTTAPTAGTPDAQQDSSNIPPLIKRPDAQDAATPNNTATLPDWLTGKLPSFDSAAPAQTPPADLKPPAQDVSAASSVPAPAQVAPATQQITQAPPLSNGILPTDGQSTWLDHAQVPGRPRGPFDKIPDGEPGADSWRNQHNKLREGLAFGAAALAELGGRDPWGTNGRPGEGVAVLEPWLQSEAAKRQYDVNLPAIQQQADINLREKQAEIAQKNAAANSQFVFDPNTGRYVPVKVAVAQTAAQPKLLSAGFNPVTGKPLTEEESSRSQNAKVELDQSHKELFDAQQAQALAKADLDKAANDPNSPLYQLKLKQYEMTQKRFQLATERVNLAYRNFGVNTYGIDFGNNSALQSGAAAGAQGHAAPGGTAGNTAPANNTATGTNDPHGVPQGNDNQPLVPNGTAIKAARQSLASGEDHKSVLAFNTASGHLSQLQDAIDALNNNDLKGLNAIANKYGVATGQSAPVVFDAIRNAVAGELGKVFKGQVTDSEVAHIGSTLGNDLSPQALSGVVKADANLMMSKLAAVHDSYFGLTGEHPYVLFPEGAAAFKKLGVELPSWASAASTPTNRTKQPQAPATSAVTPASSTFNPATDFKPIGKH